MEYIFIDYGRHRMNQIQTMFSIISILAYGEKNAHIHIVTDAPDVYQTMDWEVDVIAFDQQQLKEWLGAHKYTFRAKIEALHYAVENVLAHGAKETSHFMFLDSDTFAYRDISALDNIISSGKAIMHANEGMPYLTKGPSTRLWKMAKGQTFHGITIGEGCEMWNSGVIGMPQQKAREICQLALQLCDEMLDAGINTFNVEQYSFSLALRKYCGEIIEVRDHICHYWGNKEGWQRYILEFLLSAWLEKKPVEQIKNDFIALDKSKVPYYFRDPIWRRRLVACVSWLIPIKRLRYAGND